MTTIRRVIVNWQTGAGGPGVSVFYSPFGTDSTVALAAFFNGMKSSFPPVVTWNIPAAGDVLTVENGAVTGAWIGGTAATITGTGSAQYFAGTGAYVRWITGAVHNRRKVYGRTFLCPVINAGADSDGTIGSGTLAAIQSAATTLAATSGLMIWSRPTSTTANDGAAFPVVGAVAPDKTTSLKSRRH